MNSN
jgi:hypothetical protein